MRIGKVSEIYHISADNLYYYINYGLLVPPRPKGQYVFDQATLKDLEWILELKDLDFSLREIHIILSLKRVSGFADPQFWFRGSPGSHGIKGNLQQQTGSLSKRTGKKKRDHSETG